MKFKFTKTSSESAEGQKIISAIAETTDERCVKITQTLISLSHLRGVEHPPEAPPVPPYKL
jgi:hypothetical protein